MAGPRTTPSQAGVPAPPNCRYQAPKGDEADWSSPDSEVEPHGTINEIRRHVDEWRAGHWKGSPPRVQHLLEYWAREGEAMRPFWCQREAVETLIWLFEAGRTQAPEAHAAIVERLVRVNRQWNEGIPRVALKMATGTGKTNLMAMIAPWWAVRHPDGPVDFLALTPGLTIRDRLQVLANYENEICSALIVPTTVAILTKLDRSAMVGSVTEKSASE